MGQQSRGMEARTVVVVVCILLTEMCERLTYYGVSGNLVLFCTSGLKLTSQEAVSVQLVFVGTSYLFPVLGGYVADSIAGRYNTILGSGLIYVVGVFLFPACSADYVTWFGKNDAGVEYDMSVEAKRGFFLSGLALVAIGTGGIKANVGPFGAQQVAKHGPEAVQSFFNWFYWFVNLGALLASTGVAYVQQSISFTWGFVIPLLSMAVALVIFAAARGQYVHTPPGGSVLTTAIKVCHQGCSCCSKDPEVKYRPFLHSALAKNGGDFDEETVDGVKALLKILPILALLIGYATVYSQMQSTFFLQSERLSVRVGGGEIPAAMLNVFNTIVILLLIPLVDRVIYPCLNRCGRPLPLLRRMSIGMFFGALSMVVAGVVEIYRKQELTSSGGQTQVLGGQTFNSSHISVFVQIPQFALVGAAEVFTSIPSIEFAFTQAPPSMQGLLTGVFYAIMGLGNYVATLLIAIVNAANKDPWLPDELNEGHGEYLFFLLCGLLLLNLLVFLLATRGFIYHTVQRRVSVEVEEEGELGEEGEGSIEEEALLTSDSLSRQRYTYGTTDTRL